MLRLAVLLMVLAAMLVVPGAAAHPIGLTLTTVDVQGSTLQVETRLAAPQVEPLVGAQPGRLRRSQLHQHADGLLDWYRANVAFAADRGPCAWRAGSVGAPGDGEEVASFSWVRATYDCPDSPARLAILNTLFFETEPVQENVVRVRRNGQSWDRTLRQAAPDATVELAKPLAIVVPEFVAMGVLHILNGPDHLLFLVGLILVVRGVRQALPVLSAFTVAHSITLGLAATGTVQVPPRLVEPAIALTIIYVAVENVARTEFANRWRLTFALGLVHGLGFASALQEAGLGGGTLIPSLLAFNAGVEVGQIGFVLAATPALLLLRATRWNGRAVRAGSVAIGLVGLFWLVQRLV